MGRKMFRPIRGEWEEDWREWWGPEPPYHAPVFVLTHHAVFSFRTLVRHTTGWPWPTLRSPVIRVHVDGA